MGTSSRSLQKSMGFIVESFLCRVQRFLLRSWVGRAGCTPPITMSTVVTVAPIGHARSTDHFAALPEPYRANLAGAERPFAAAASMVRYRLDPERPQPRPCISNTDEGRVQRRVELFSRNDQSDRGDRPSETFRFAFICQNGFLGNYITSLYHLRNTYTFWLESLKVASFPTINRALRPRIMTHGHTATGTAHNRQSTSA